MYSRFIWLYICFIWAPLESFTSHKVLLILIFCLQHNFSVLWLYKLPVQTKLIPLEERVFHKVVGSKKIGRKMEIKISTKQNNGVRRNYPEKKNHDLTIWWEYIVAFISSKLNHFIFCAALIIYVYYNWYLLNVHTKSLPQISVCIKNPLNTLKLVISLAKANYQNISQILISLL